MQPLPALAATATDLTASGLSSGAYMAVQMDVAYSDWLRGVGVMAGGPYDCARGSVSRALKNCMSPSAGDAPPVIEEQQHVISEAAKSGKIDSPDCALSPNRNALRFCLQFLEMGFQSERLLGLVGLFRSGLREQKRASNARHQGDD